MLVGRDAEKSVIEELVAGTAAGRSAALVLRGEPGIGKSALLAHAAEVARATGSARVIQGLGIESEAELPFAGLHLLLRGTLSRLSALPEVQATALRSALGLTEAGAGDRFLVGLAVLSLLAELAEDGPVVCLVDDAQWLDHASADALLFAARRLDAEGVALLFTARDSGFTAAGLPELRVRGLAPAAAAELLGAQGRDLAPEVRYRLLAEAGGNPLALIELPAALSDAQRAGTPGTGQLTLTDRMRATFANQVHQLPEATQTLLLIAAAEDTGELAVVLRAATALGRSVEDLEPAERAGLVHVTDTVRFRHPLVRAAVYQGAPLATRMALHRTLAEVLDTDEDADRRAWHLAAAATGPDESVAAALEHTADRARQRTGHSAAAAALDRSIGLTPDPANRTRRLIRAAEAAAEAGELDKARTLVDRITEPPADPVLRALQVYVDALTRFLAGQLATAHELLVTEGKALLATAPDQAANLLVEAVYVGWFTGEHELAVGLALLTEVDIPAAHLLRGVIPAAVGWPYHRANLDSAFSSALAECADRPKELILVCGVALTAGRDGLTQRVGTDLAARLRTEGRIGLLPNLLFLLAEAQFFHGQHTDAETTAAEGLRIATDTGQRQWGDQLASVLAVLAAVAGDEARCRELAEPLLASAGPGVPWAHWALALLDLGLGRAGAAAGRLATMVGGPAWYHVSTTRCVPDLVEAAVRVNEVGQLTEPLRRFGTWTERMGQPWALALAARCQALLADDASAEAHFQAALALHQQEPRPFEQARTELLYGEWLRRGRRKAEASTRLRAAHAVFARLGATPWADRAASELDATGVGGAPTVAPAAGPLSQLTPQETQIVRLAAQGLSNKDIAAQLFLSPRTVGYHLYKAYPKLGVVSRSELAGLTLAAG